ncbi:hypothetical protein PCIT_b0923 [Pseudoalteromonas citrea]|uniref:Uncharacterized protein n=1 Tax=Pseudoalteromonas citrea TaxID=43655 RepID=A0AAD4FQA8_9GAMM|nr:hypothetical protein PCIT_b0923 [Pseudoalteromonas citrea]
MECIFHHANQIQPPYGSNKCSLGLTQPLKLNRSGASRLKIGKEHYYDPY